MLSGTESNRGTKCLPRLARFNPQLALIGFPGTRAWTFIFQKGSITQSDVNDSAPLNIVLEDSFNGKFQAKDMTITHLGIY